MENLVVLCVEDDADAREELLYFLRKRVGKAIAASDGNDGLKKWEFYKPDVIIVDLIMPGMDGLTMIRELKNKKCDSKMIVVTSVNGVEDILKVVNEGIDYYITKPLDFSELKLKLQDIADHIDEKKKSLQTGFGNFEERHIIEDAIKNCVTRNLKEYTGKGPRETVVHISGNKIAVTFFEALTVMEENLLKDNKNFEIVKHIRRIIYENMAKKTLAFIQQKINSSVVCEKIEINIRKKIDQIVFKKV